MPLALKRYLICLSTVCVLMGIYCAIVPPILETQQREQRPNTPQAPQINTQGWWYDLFPPDAWQNNNPMRIQTAQGTLLFQSMEQLESGPGEKAGALLRLKPLTMIVPLASEAKNITLGDITAASRMYNSSTLAIIVSQEGADILFQEAPDWTSSAKPPPVEGGRLTGAIQITGVDPRKKTVDGKAQTDWLIRTSYVNIQGRRIWTNNDVEILSQNSAALGKGLSIFLKQDLLAPGANGDGPWGLLDRLELNVVKQVKVNLPPGGLWKGLALGPPEIAAAHADVPASLQLLCKRNFEFDFDSSTAKLTDHVHMDHRFDNEEAFDEFKCHELKIAFSVPSPNQPPDPDAVMVGPMKLDAIEAVGIDSVGPLPSQSTVAINAPIIASSVRC